jgi:hypothetical protein
MKKYFDQAKLMLSILPIVSQEENFALKGGTALNFFYFQTLSSARDSRNCTAAFR